MARVLPVLHVRSTIEQALPDTRSTKSPSPVPIRIAPRRDRSGMSPATDREIEAGPADDAPIMAIIGPDGTISRTFPGYEAREPQLRLAHAIASSTEGRNHFVGEAGTGVGKSFAYLSAVLHQKRKVVVAVPTLALMDQLLTKDIPFLQTPGVIPGGFRYALLKGRGNYLCRYKYEAFKVAPSFEDRRAVAQWPDVQDWARTTTDGDTGKLNIPLLPAIKSEITATSDECIGDACPMQGTCFAESAKARAQDADLIVTNLAMLMMDVRMRRDSDGIVSVLPDGIETLVIDECHRLYEAAQSAFEREFTLGRFEYIAKRALSLVRRSAEANAATAQADEMIRAASEGREPVSVTPSTVEDDWRARIGLTRLDLQALLSHYVARLREPKELAPQRLGDETECMMDALVSLDALRVELLTVPAGLSEGDRKTWEKLHDACDKIVSDLVNAGMPGRDSQVVRYISIDDQKAQKAGDVDALTITVTPIDVAPILRESLWDATFYRPSKEALDESHRTPLTVIAVSATIATQKDGLNFWMDRVGLVRESANTLIVGSPFDYASNALTYVPTNANDFDSSAARKAGPDAWQTYLRRLATEYGRLIMASGGRAFALFTSNTVLDYVHGKIGPTLESRGIQVLRQGQASQGELVRRMRERPSVLFGVKSYWEGVDIQGEALSMVIISGMPFVPPSDLVYKAQCDLIDRRYGNRASFRLLSIPDAILALKQAYGRGVRSTTDRAVIAILDGRLRSKNYGADVLSSLPPAPVTGSGDDVVAFFA